MKAGYKTSEFWLAMTAMTLQLLTGFGVLDQTAAVGAAAVAGSYAVGRGVAKRPKG